MIPKKIHYCWVGGAPKPQSVLYCIESWKKYCPDYEIIEWNESNYDFRKNQYMSDAYDTQKWGFVPDYARLDIIYHHGGIYLDTDVEMIRCFDELLNYKAFFGFEASDNSDFFVNCGQGFGAEPFHSLIKQLLDVYENKVFIKNDGSLNLLPSPHYTTDGLVNYGLKRQNIDQHLQDAVVFASDVLCPKNFVTGKIKKTNRTVSIHHFTASWMDEEIVKSVKHSQKIKNKYGEFIGSKILVLESAYEKYGIFGILKRPFIRLSEHLYGYSYLIKAKFRHKKRNLDKIVIFDTALDSKNLGDGIIMDYCEKQLSDIIPVREATHIHTHIEPDVNELSSLDTAELKILCGTNLLSGFMRSYGLWKIPHSLRGYYNIVSMGIGFDSEDPKFDLYSKLLFKSIFSRNRFLSVRDSFTENKLHRMGIKNAINTSCPTMWKLTPEHCRQVPRKKSSIVVCTLTDYNKDVNSDTEILNVLFNEYEKVFYWPQGDGDLEYIKEIGCLDKVCLIERSLEAYDQLLRNNCIDYVGTRLHAGIRALNYQRRTIIVSIDNRARSIARDSNLPIIERESISDKLVNWINSEYITDIKIPLENIKKWKEQFEDR